MLKCSVCLFVKNFAVPFDNNQTEQDICNVKTKKHSHRWLPEHGRSLGLPIHNVLFCTANKHGINAFKAPRSAFVGDGTISWLWEKLKCYYYL